MPDLPMCVGTGCGRRGQCYRFLAEPAPRQQVMNPPPLKPASGACSYFWPAQQMRPGSKRSFEAAEQWAAAQPAPKPNRIETRGRR